MAKTKVDAYVNRLYGDVTMSAANTLTFAQILLGVGLFQGMALLIHRVLWYPVATTLREVVAAADSFNMALTSSNRVVDILETSDPAVLCRKSVIGIGVGTEPFEVPFITDFSTLPGGGKLVPANPLYVAMASGGFAAAGRTRVEIESTFIELASNEYLELLQAVYPANIA